MTTPRRNRIDLHTHTARSDGVLQPHALYERMRAWGTTLAAITDHDTLAGARELLDAGLGGPAGRGPRLIIGVEINTCVDDELMAAGGRLERWAELHVLGFGVDPHSADFATLLEAQRGGRTRRLRVILEHLRELGIDVEADLPEVEGSIDSLGRPHVARALVAGGHATSVEDAFARYLSPGRPAYVRRSGMGPRAAIEAVVAAGGIAALAHAPWAPDEHAVMEILVDWGLRGLEAYYGGWDDEAIGRMADRARELGLLPTGGSDYHGDSGDYAMAQTSLHVPDEVGERMQEALGMT